MYGISCVRSNAVNYTKQKNYLTEVTIRIIARHFTRKCIFKIYFFNCEISEQFLSQSCFKVNPTPGIIFFNV